MERLGAFLLPPGWDASPSQGLYVGFQKTRKSVIYLTGEKLWHRKITKIMLLRFFSWGLTFEAVKGLVIWRNFALQKWCNSVNKLEPHEIQKRHRRRLSPKKLYFSSRAMSIWLYSILGLISGIFFVCVCVFDCGSLFFQLLVFWTGKRGAYLWPFTGHIFVLTFFSFILF